MSILDAYVVQYVGFSANIDSNTFISRWAPFAKQFKAMGIQSIDLYQNTNESKINFLSRNVWDKQTYLKNFSTGIAGAGGGGGISVTQFGGYWLPKDHLQKQDYMQLLFTNSLVISDIEIKSYPRCTNHVPFLNVLEAHTLDGAYILENSVYLICAHIQTM